jgi:hypothetical protein
MDRTSGHHGACRKQWTLWSPSGPICEERYVEWENESTSSCWGDS